MIAKFPFATLVLYWTMKVTLRFFWEMPQRNANRESMQQLSQRNEEHLRRIVTIDENCVKIQDQAARVKSDVQQLVPSLVRQ